MSMDSGFAHTIAAKSLIELIDTISKSSRSRALLPIQIRLEVQGFSPQELIFALNLCQRTRFKISSIEISLQVNEESNFALKTASVLPWQVFHAISRIHNLEIDNIETFNSTLWIRVLLRKQYLPPKSLCIGYIARGQVDERNALVANFERWKEVKFEKLTVRYAVVLDRAFDSAEWHAFSKKYDVHLVFYDQVDEDAPKTTLKKSQLLKMFDDDIFFIAHCRITPWKVDEFELLYSKTGFSTPQVTYQGKPYLDLVYVESLEAMRSSRAVPCFSAYHSRAGLDLLKTHLPYIDGGIFFIDRRYVPKNCFDNPYAWGEAEDLATASYLYSTGIIASHLSGNIFESATNKRKSLSKFKYWLRRPLLALKNISSPKSS